MQVDFYHLDAMPIERVLPRIGERLLAGGGRLLVVAGDEAMAARLDTELWTYAVDAFLPHGRAGEEGEANQPILIAVELEPVNGARNLLIADGRWRPEALDFERTFYLFDAATLDAARAAWRTLSGREDVQRNFWREEDGRWIKAA
jgi:DNA polymerase-3 subunit chi